MPEKKTVFDVFNNRKPAQGSNMLYISQEQTMKIDATFLFDIFSPGQPGEKSSILIIFQLAYISDTEVSSSPGCVEWLSLVELLVIPRKGRGRSRERWR